MTCARISRDAEAAPPFPSTGFLLDWLIGQLFYCGMHHVQPRVAQLFNRVAVNVPRNKHLHNTTSSPQTDLVASLSRWRTVSNPQAFHSRLLVSCKRRHLCEGSLQSLPTLKTIPDSSTILSIASHTNYKLRSSGQHFWNGARVRITASPIPFS